MEVPLRSRFAGVAVVAALLTAGVVFFGTGSVRVPPLQPSAAAGHAPAPPGLLTVHVSGEVASPGLVGVPSGARYADVIAAAGGATLGADLGSLNLAAAVRDGDRVLVPAWTPDREAGRDGLTAERKVKINIADPGELEMLPGVGPVLAQRIAGFRETHGPFTEIEDLLGVPGIGEAKLAGLRDYVDMP